MTEAPTYDVFISHAFEDKTSFVNELAMELTKSGLKVWYSGFDLKLGDSISGSINEALKRSAFGIVVISPVYLQKQWAMNELNALFAQETGQYRILPILHNITVDEIRKHFPILADRYTVSSEKGMDFIINKVLQAMSSLKKGQGKISFPAVKSEETHRLKAGKQTKPDAVSNTSISKNSSNVTVDSGNNVVILLVLLIVVVVVFYFFFVSPGMADAGISKENVTPSNSN